MKMKIVSLLIVIALLLTNISYAVELSNEKLKASFEEIFSKEVRFIQWENQDGGRATSSSSLEKVEDTQITDNQIILKEEGYEFVYNYKIEGNVVEVDFEKKVEMSDETEEDSYELFAYTYVGNATLEKIYVAIADALEVNLDAAYGYFKEAINKTEEQEGVDETTGDTYTIIDTDVADIVMISNEENGYISLNYKVDIDVLSKITKDSFSSTKNYAIIVTDVPESEEEEDWLNTWIDNYEKENNLNQNEGQNNTNTNVSTNVTNTNTNTNTNTQTEMPKTGIAYETVYFLLGVIALCFVVGYRVYRAK